LIRAPVLAYALFRRRWLVVAPALVCLYAVVCNSQQKSPEYDFSQTAGVLLPSEFKLELSAN
jgi:hypothetical protein